HHEPRITQRGLATLGRNQSEQKVNGDNGGSASRYPKPFCSVSFVCSCSEIGFDAGCKNLRKRKNF
ncbi:MAG: hypothetical protein KY476_17370, partial [Planctomycetes bacterium]|nr:hypothetical protein [Planctomycetota bacterium]